MGWLRDRMQDKELGSFKALIQQMEKSAGWPSKPRPASRSLTNYLNDADAGRVRWWLNGKGKRFVRPLAHAIEEPESEVIRLLEAASTPDGASTGLMPFAAFPDLAPLNFETEGLFPGIPPVLTEKGGPKFRRAWWLAPSGAGKELVGRWLHLRHRWRFLTAGRWDEIALPDHGDVFLELETSDGITVGVLNGLPRALRLCIACPEALPMAPRLGAKPNEWTDAVHLRTPPASDWLDALVDWVAARAPPDGYFEREAARRLVHAEYADAPAATPGDVLSFLALVDKQTVKHFASGADRAPLVNVWLERAEGRTHPNSDARLIRRRGAELLIGMETARLRSARPATLPEDEWITLVPPSVAPATIDGRRVKQLLEKGRTEDAKRLLDPPAQEWVQALRRCRALVPSAGGLKLQPAWLARAISDSAFTRLMNDPEGLGTLALNASTSEQAIRLVFDELARGDTSRTATYLERVSSTPEHLAACDAIFRAVGLLLTIPSAHLDLRIVERTWEVYDRYSHDLFPPWPPDPFVAVGEANVKRGLSSNGGRWLAAFVIAHWLLRHGRRLPTSSLNPSKEMLDGSQDALTAPIVDIVEAFEGAAPGSDQQLAPFRLGGMLLDRGIVLRGYPRANAIQTPDLLARNAKTSEYEANLRRASLHWPALLDACKRHEVDLKVALERGWLVWGRHGGVYAGDGTPEQVRMLWSSLGAHALSVDGCHELLRAPQAWPWLARTVWERMLPALLSDGAPPELFDHLPEELALRVIRDGRTYEWHEMKRRVWARFPQQIIGALAEDAKRSTSRDFVLHMAATAAPDQHVPELIRSLRPARAPWVRTWMVEVVRKRRPGWREAAAALVETSADSVNHA